MLRRIPLAVHACCGCSRAAALAGMAISADEESFFAKLPALGAAFRAPVAIAGRDCRVDLLASVEFGRIRRLFQPWRLDEKPAVAKLTPAQRSAAAARLPGRVKVRAPKVPQAAKAAAAPAAPPAAGGGIFKSAGVLPSTAASGVKRPRSVGDSVAAALARGDSKAAKRLVHTAAMGRAAAAGAGMAAERPAKAARVGGWDADGAFHASNGVVLPKADELCKYHIIGACRQGAACSYSHDLAAQPCRHAHAGGAATLRAALAKASPLPAAATAVLAATPGSCPLGASCRFLHGALTPAAYARLEREAVRLHRAGGAQ